MLTTLLLMLEANFVNSHVRSEESQCLYLQTMPIAVSSLNRIDKKICCIHLVCGLVIAS